MSRADKFTLKQKQSKVYSDFLMNFDKNPFTGYLATAENEEAVKNSIRQYVLTNKGERFYDSNKGGDIRDHLFELVDLGDAERLKFDLKNGIQSYEPRADIVDIEVTPTDDNILYISITFAVANIQDQVFNLDLHIERVR